MDGQYRGIGFLTALWIRPPSSENTGACLLSESHEIAHAREVSAIDFGIARQMLPFDRPTARHCIVSSADATVAVMEVTMHKVIGVMSLVSALVISQSVNAQGVDLAKLPSIGSIAATTDIRPFLAQGVPPRLMRAALHRAWVVDPRIRDFRGLQENDWAFNDPSGVPGSRRDVLPGGLMATVATGLPVAALSRDEPQARPCLLSPKHRN